MPKRRYLVLSDRERAELEAHRDHDPRPFVRERCAALVRIADGASAHAVARTGILRPRHPDTVYCWLDRYQAEGLAGLVGHQQGGSVGGRLRPGGPGGDPRPGAPWPG